jgi:hypothetical protein
MGDRQMLPVQTMVTRIGSAVENCWPGMLMTPIVV